MDIAAAATPMRLLSVNRSTATRQFLVLAAAVTVGLAVCGYVVVGLLQQVLPWTLLWPLDAALLLGAVGGLGGSAAYVLALTAWGQWLTVARFWLPLTRRLPWDTAAFLDDAYRRGCSGRPVPCTSSGTSGCSNTSRASTVDPAASPAT